LKAGIELPKETDRKKEHITGILTSDSAIAKIKERQDLVQAGGHKCGRPSKATSETNSEDTMQSTTQGRESDQPSMTTDSENTVQSTTPVRKRGRPRKAKSDSSVPATKGDDTVQPTAKGCKRSRTSMTTSETDSEDIVQSTEKVRKRVRRSITTSDLSNPATDTDTVHKTSKTNAPKRKSCTKGK